MNGKIIAVVNQKGGVGKTTTVFNLGVALVNAGKKVLLVDTDPQGDLTTYMGWYNSDELPLTLADLMEQSMNDKPIYFDKVILHHKERLDLIPANLDLSAMEMSLVNAMSREYTLKRCIYDLKKKYDYILIDCSPSLGMITVNALATSDEVIIPVQSQYLALRGMTQLIQTINKVRRQINPNLSIAGVLLTLFDRRTNLSKNVDEILHSEYGSQLNIFKSKIPIAIKTAESSIYGKSILSYDRKNPVSEAYCSLALEVISNEKERFGGKIEQVR